MVGHPITEFFPESLQVRTPINGDALWYTADGELITEFRQKIKLWLARLSDSPWQVVLELPSCGKGFHRSAQFSWMAKRYVMNKWPLFEESNRLYSAYNQSTGLLYDRWKSPVILRIFPPRCGGTTLTTALKNTSISFCLKNLTLAYSLPGNRVEEK